MTARAVWTRDALVAKGLIQPATAEDLDKLCLKRSRAHAARQGAKSHESLKRSCIKTLRMFFAGKVFAA